MDCQEPSWTVRNLQGPSGTVRNLQGPSGIFRDQQEPSGTFRDHQEPLWTVRNLVRILQKLSRTFRNCQEQLEPLNTLSCSYWRRSFLYFFTNSIAMTINRNWTVGTQLLGSRSNLFFLIDSGLPLGQYQIIDVISFVRNASKRYREPYLWILTRYSYGSIKSPLSLSNFEFGLLTLDLKSGLGMFALLCSFQNWYWKVKLGKI